jgi:hypothetical protein
MKFSRKNFYYEISDCGFYVVCKVMVRNAWLYEAWFRPDGLPSLESNRALIRLGDRPRGPEAEELCKEHKMRTAT